MAVRHAASTGSTGLLVAPSTQSRFAAASALHVRLGLLPSPRHQFAKRAFDVVISVPFLLLMLLLYPLIMLATWLDSPGPILYRQVRIGKGGQPFVMYKFRTMRHTATDGPDPVYEQIARKWMAGLPVDEMGEPLQAQRQRGGSDVLSDRTSDKAPGLETTAAALQRARPYYKFKRDPRITRVGRLLRLTSLDELPQFMNVLRGDMSVVGPRPPVLYEVERYSERELARLSVMPGITGLWQVTGRGRVTFQEMVTMDLDYVVDNSLRRDLVLVLLTVPAVLTGNGAT